MIILSIAYHYFRIYDNHIILGDFIKEPNDPVLTSFIQPLNLFNLINSNTCFKQDGTCVDLILKNTKYCLKYFLTHKTNPSDDHHLIL